MASLETIDGATCFDLIEPEIVVGRRAELDQIELDPLSPPKVAVGHLPGGKTVSRSHARICHRDGTWWLSALEGATNGTLVAGRPVRSGEEVPLTNGALVQLGHLVLVFKTPQIAAERPTSDAPDETQEVPPISERPAQPDGQTDVGPELMPDREAEPVPLCGFGDWAARIPERPAAVAALGVSELKRINPFQGLMIDETVWADAHEYHRVQSRLHYLGAHGWGIVEGLEVVADPLTPGTVVVRPGIAVDPKGQALLVPRERRLPVAAEEGATLFVVLRFREELAQAQRFWSDTDEYTRVVERSEAVVERQSPHAPAIELARVSIDGDVRNAIDPLDPRSGEIDLRFRERLSLRPRPELAVAELVLAGSDRDAGPSAHRIGLRYLLKEIGLTTAYRPRWAGVCLLSNPLPPVSLLYSASAGRLALDGDDVSRLRDFLDEGGVLVVDACLQGKAAKSVSAVEKLATTLGRRLRPVSRGHPILRARHVFAEPPLGEGGTLTEGGGLVLSTADLGCAWQGGPPRQPLPRESIRAALELGVNFAVCARQRQRPLDLLDLEV